MRRLAFAGALLLAQVLGGGTAHAAANLVYDSACGLLNVELGVNGADVVLSPGIPSGVDIDVGQGAAETIGSFPGDMCTR